jgi:hypothetical protein
MVNARLGPRYPRRYELARRALSIARMVEPDAETATLHARLVTSFERRQR